MTKRSERQLLLAYARDAVLILRQALERVENGQVYDYRVAAVQLRLLLCDTTRRHGQMLPTALAGRLWSDLRLPAPAGAQPGAGFLLEDWLELKLPEGDFTIRQFIRRVCDQDGGAHVDFRRHARLPETFQSAIWICRLGELALAALDPLLAEER